MHAQASLFGATTPPRRFDQDALGFLIKFARRRKGRAFSAEQVTLAALRSGIEPGELRSWGAIFTRAAREGHIRRSEVLFQRSMGNGTLAPGWVGCHD